MSDDEGADVIGLGYGKAKLSLKERIDARVAVLEAWCAHGVPIGRTVPKSLAAIRRWDAPDLGIFPIGSPNGFTLNDPIHGEGVRRVFDAMNAALASNPSAAGDQKKVPEGQPPLDLTYLVSQWHSERALAQELAKQRQSEATQHTRDTAALRARIEQLEGTVADLTRRVSGSSGFRIVD